MELGAKVLGGYSGEKRGVLGGETAAIDPIDKRIALRWITPDISFESLCVTKLLWNV